MMAQSTLSLLRRAPCSSLILTTSSVSCSRHFPQGSHDLFLGDAAWRGGAGRSVAQGLRACV